MLYYQELPIEEIAFALDSSCELPVLVDEILPGEETEGTASAPTIYFIYEVVENYFSPVSLKIDPDRFRVVIHVEQQVATCVCHYLNLKQGLCAHIASVLHHNRSRLVKPLENKAVPIADLAKDVDNASQRFAPVPVTPPASASTPEEELFSGRLASYLDEFSGEALIQLFDASNTRTYLPGCKGKINPAQIRRRLVALKRQWNEPTWRETEGASDFRFQPTSVATTTSGSA